MEGHLNHPNKHQQQRDQPPATNVDSTEGTQAETLQSSLNINSDSLLFSLHSIENRTTSIVDVKGKSKTRLILLLNSTFSIDTCSNKSNTTLINITYFESLYSL